MSFSLKNSHDRRLCGALLATATLVNAALFYGVYNLGTLVLAGLGLLLWGRWFTEKGRGPRWLANGCKWLCRAGWSFFLGSCLLMYALTWARALPADAQPAVIVVPGAQVNHDRPSLMLQNRLDRGLQLWRSHPGSVFVVTGGKDPGDSFSEAEVMTAYLVEQGVDPKDIYPETQASNTRENFYYSAQIIQKNQLEGPVVVATDAFHQTRCRLWAARSGLPKVYSAVCVPCWGIAPVFWLREVCGVAHFFVFC